MILCFLLWWFMSCSTFQKVSFWGTWQVLLVHDCIIGQNTCPPWLWHSMFKWVYQSRHNVESLFTNIPTGLSPSSILNNVYHWFSIPCLQSGAQFFNVVCYYHRTLNRHSVWKSLERVINIISLMKWGGEDILGVPVLLLFFVVMWMKENWRKIGLDIIPIISSEYAFYDIISMKLKTWLVSFSHITRV